MPIYTLIDKNTNVVFEKTMKIAEYVEYVKENSNIERYYESVPLLCDPTRLMDTVVSKGDQTFNKYVLGRIASSVPGNNIGENKRFNATREW